MTTQPAQKKFSYRVNMFDGGLVTNVNPSDLLPNQSPECQDVQFSTTGYVESNYGHSKWISTALASAPIDGLAVHKANVAAPEYLVAICNGSVYRSQNYSWEAVSGGTSIFTSGLDVFGVHSYANLYMCDGLNLPHKYDGNEIYQAGILATTQSAASLSSLSTAGGLTAGVHLYGMTAVSGGGQENGFTYLGSVTLTASSVSVDISGLPVYPASAGTVTYRNIYRTHAGGTTYYKAVTLSDNTTTACSDISAVGVAMPTDLGSMPICKYLIEYKGFMLAAGNNDYPTRLYYSEQGYPEYWPPANYLEVGQDDGYPITGLRVYNGVLFISKHDGYDSGTFYTLNMTSSTPTSWVLEKSNAQFGSVNDKSVVGFDNKIVFMTKSGIYNLLSNYLSDNPQTTTLGTVLVDSIAAQITTVMESLNISALHKAAAIDYRGTVYFAVPTGSNSTNNVVLMYDHGTMSSTTTGAGSWSLATYPAVNKFVVYKGDLYGGDSVNGYVYKMNEDSHNYDGAANAGYYWTPYIYGPPEHRDYTKVWRFLLVGVEMVGNWNIEIGYRGDPQTDPTLKTESLLPTGSVWGTFVWGDNWGATTVRRYYKIILLNMVSKMIQIRLRTTAVNEWFRVFDIKLDYNLRGQR